MLADLIRDQNMDHLIKVIMKFAFVRLGILYQVTQGFFIYLLSSKPSILILNPIKSTKKIAIFAAYRESFDRATDLTLCELKKRGFHIVFVSNCSLSQDFIRQLKNKADIVIQRGNYGRCIAAYKAAYLFLYGKKFYGAKDMLFLNDTMIFPVADSHFFWKDLDRSKADVAGIFESNEFGYHLQSYFLYCKNKVFLNQNFYNFWVKYMPFNSKQLIIKYGELGFSKMLSHHNISTYAFINESKLRKLIANKKTWIAENQILSSWGSPLSSYIAGLDFNANPSHIYALLSLKFLHLPLMKTDLISAGSYSKQQIMSFLKTVKTSANKDLILSSLKSKQDRSFIHKLKSYMGML